MPWKGERRRKREGKGEGGGGGGGGGGVLKKVVRGRGEGEVRERGERGSVSEVREGSEVVRWDVSGKREREGRCGREGRRELSGHACE